MGGHPPSLSFTRGTSAGVHASAPDQPLLIRVVMVMVMMMMVMAVDNHHNLRLRRVRCREAEDKSKCEHNPFHTSVSRTAAPFAELL
jgi:hypothetical protein